jgi:hypothetical protein
MYNCCDRSVTVTLCLPLYSLFTFFRLGQGMASPSSLGLVTPGRTYDYLSQEMYQWW